MADNYIRGDKRKVEKDNSFFFRLSGIIRHLAG